MGNECTLKMHKEHANSQPTKESLAINLDNLGDPENVKIFEILHIITGIFAF